MKLRSLAFPCAVLSLFSMYCGGSTTPGTGGTAIVYVSDGGDCDADYECDSDSCTAGVCDAPTGGLVEIDGTCTGSDCVADATCTGGTCVADSGTCGDDGEGCEDESDCCSGTCSSSNVCGGETGTGGSGGEGTGGEVAEGHLLTGRQGAVLGAGEDEEAVEQPVDLVQFDAKPFSQCDRLRGHRSRLGDRHIQ